MSPAPAPTSLRVRGPLRLPVPFLARARATVPDAVGRTPALGCGQVDACAPLRDRVEACARRSAMGWTPARGGAAA